MQDDRIGGIQGLILDMDGVLWKDNTPLVNLPFVFGQIRKKQLKVMFATNNASRTPLQIVEKLEQMGVEIEPWQVINSANVAAERLAQKFPDGGPVFIVGEIGLISALADRGFYPADQNVLAVVAGIDRFVTYEKLRVATLLIRQGAPFIGTNPDRTFPTPAGLVPGAGSILAAIQTATDVVPEIVGKPYPFMFELSLQRMKLSAESSLAVGDRLDTDILGGFQAGCRTALVLSGIATREDAARYNPKPDWIENDLAELVEKIL
jgi:4-nitrophenyl phosphatase